MMWRRHGDPLAVVERVPWNKGKKGTYHIHSEEARKKISEHLKGRPVSAKTRRKISESEKGKKGLVGKKNWNYGKKGPLHPKFGIKLSKESKRRISNAKRGEKNPMFGKPSWNKGLTKESHPSVKKISEKMKGTKIRVGYKTPEKTKSKISNTLKTKWKTEKHYMIGWVPSKETRRKIGAKHKGKTIPDEMRQKLRKANLGKKASEETRRKISKSNTGKKRSKEQRERMSKTQRRLIKEGRKKFPYFSEESREKLRKKRLDEKFPKKDTKFEKSVQNALKKKGVGFETHKAILGQPDIFIKPNLCIFADGDFWHVNPNEKNADGTMKYPDEAIIHKERYSKTQKKITSAITAKIIRQKDKKKREKLRDMGYVIIQFYESEWEKDQKKCLQKIIKAMK